MISRTGRAAVPHRKCAGGKGSKLVANGSQLEPGVLCTSMQFAISVAN